MAGQRHLNRTLTYYRRGVDDFAAFGLAPPLAQAASIPVEELLAQLVEVHEMALTRLSNDTDRAFASAIRKAGSQDVHEVLLSELANMYGVTVGDLSEAISLAHTTDIESLGLFSVDQPRGEDGKVDGQVLEREALVVLEKNGAADGPVRTHFAQCGDPRFPLQLALIRVTPTSVAWCSLLRPHSFDEVFFRNTIVVWHDGPYWRFKVDKWRPRRFRPIGNDDRWAPLMNAIRENSAAAGLVWKQSWEGRRPRR